MKIAITTTEPRITAATDPRFGRAAYFVLVDSKTLEWQAHENPAVDAAGGAGTQAAQFVAQQGVDAVISGDFGPNAHAALSAAEIAMYLLGASKTAWEAVGNFNAGVLTQAQVPFGSGRHGGRGA